MSKISCLLWCALKKNPFLLYLCIFFSQFLEIESYQFTVSQRGLRKSSISENPYYATYYVFWSKVFLMELIPYALITILNGFIIAKIYSSYKFRKQFIVNRRPSSPGEQQRKYSSIPVIQEEENLVDGNTQSPEIRCLCYKICPTFGIQYPNFFRFFISC